MALEAEESGFGSWLLLPISCMKTESQFDNLKKNEYNNSYLGMKVTMMMYVKYRAQKTLNEPYLSYSCLSL